MNDALMDEEPERQRPAQTRRDARIPRAEDLEHLPVVAIVGRPNTGKSTLFNRVARTRRALVASMPGVTRDRNVAVAAHEGRRFLIVDTGGFEAEEDEDMARAVRAQSLLAAEESDAVILVVDGRAGVSPLDRALLERLRRLRQPLFLAVNKLDTPALEHLRDEFYALGVDALHPISAEHGLNVDALIESVLAALPGEEEEAPVETTATPVAIIGRPNVGKSSLLNRLVGYDRAVVTPVPGTTRDAIDTPVRHDGRDYLLVDTAGVRRRSKVQEHVERASVVRALRALERADVALLVVDALEGMTEQDARISGYAWERGRALLLVVNKWDAVARESRSQKEFAAAVERRFPSLAVVPKRFVSALTGRGVNALWPAIERVAANHRAELRTARLNDVLHRAAAQQAPPAVRGRRARFFYAVQSGTAPVTISVFCRAPESIPAPYERYLENRLRAAFDLEGVPLRLRFRSRR
jgi:GTP-binding protein